MILKWKEVGELAFKFPLCWDEAWENDSQDLPSVRCVTDSLPWLHKQLQHVCHLASLLCHPVLDGQRV